MAEKKKVLDETVWTICRPTRKKYMAGEKARIVQVGLRGESTMADMCCRELFM